MRSPLAPANRTVAQRQKAEHNCRATRAAVRRCARPPATAGSPPLARA
jgi:hypothetical protein